MEILVAFLVIFGSTQGLVEVSYIHYGDTELPSNGQIANEKWKMIEEDSKLKIKWYIKNNEDTSIQMAFDEKQTLAGVRLSIPKDVSAGDEFYRKSNLFKEETINIDGNVRGVYISTVLFTDQDILRSGGRMKNEYDEIVESVRLLNKKGEKRVQREACAQVKTEGNVFTEQGCKPNHGLVLAPFSDSSSSCDNAVFLVYNEDDKGELIGFGWLVPVRDIPSSTVLGNGDIEALFPSSPDCLLSGMTSVNIWLARTEIFHLQCKVPAGQFVSQRCGSSSRPRGDNF